MPKIEHTSIPDETNRNHRHRRPHAARLGRRLHPQIGMQGRQKRLALVIDRPPHRFR